MEINSVNKYCHVSAYVAYDNCSPVFKKTFRFEISPSSHNSIIWDKIIKVLRKMELKWSLSLEAVSYLCFSPFNPFFNDNCLPSSS